MSTVQITRENFKANVDRSGITLLDFWAEWCGPCRAFGPTFEKAAEKHTDIVFGKVNTEEERELAAQFGIRAIPTLVALRDGILLFQEPGVLSPPLLESLVAQLRELDMNAIRREMAEPAAAPTEA